LFLGAFTLLSGTLERRVRAAHNLFIKRGGSLLATTIFGLNYFSRAMTTATFCNTLHSPHRSNWCGARSLTLACDRERGRLFSRPLFLL